MVLIISVYNMNEAMSSYPEQEPGALHAADVGQTDGQISRRQHINSDDLPCRLTSGMLVMSAPSWWVFVTALGV